MSIAILRQAQVVVVILGVATVGSLFAQDEAGKTSKDPASLARIEFLRNVVGKITVKTNDSTDSRDLVFKPQPILRYSDPARKIADSAVWRVGAKGRPVALVTSEIYGPFGPDDGRSYQLNHEFLAIDRPRMTMRCGPFTWAPPSESALNFQKFKSAERPAGTAQLRLIQMKRLAQQFTLREHHQGSQIELRLLPTPLDRYEPSDRRGPMARSSPASGESIPRFSSSSNPTASPGRSRSPDQAVRSSGPYSTVTRSGAFPISM